MKDAINFARAFVRPYISYFIITAIMVLAIKLALKYADAEVAKTVVVFILGAGATIMGFYFGERKKS